MFATERTNMDGVPIQLIDIPPDIRRITNAGYSFYKVPSPLETQNFTGKLLCVVLFTELKELIEIEDGCVIRLEILPEIKKAKKLLVHHEFFPMRRFIAILVTGNVVHLLDYENFKHLGMWEDVKDITSDDPSECGRPRLCFLNTSGEKYMVSEDDFLLGVPPRTDASSRSEAVTALNNKVKSMVSLAEGLQLERSRKERFICQKTADLERQLQRSSSHDDEAQEAACDELLTNQSAMKGSQGEQPLRVLFVRQRTIHNKWVICINLQSQLKSSAIENIDLILHSEDVSRSMRFEVHLYKLFHWVSNKGEPRMPGDIIVERVDPPILRPKKKGFLLALCEMPEFFPSARVNCDGVITFEIGDTERGVNGWKRPPSQITFPAVHLSATDLAPVVVSVTLDPEIAGFPLDILALMASSVSQTLTIVTRATPLNHFIRNMTRDGKLIKVSHLRDFYCFEPSECPPLRFAAFICRLSNATTLLLTTYTKDEAQGILLMHNIKAALPYDASIHHNGVLHSQTLLGKTLRPKLHLAVNKIQGVFNDSRSAPVHKKPRKDPQDASDSSPDMDSVWIESEYLKWRSELHSLWLEMESLFRQSKIT